MPSCCALKFALNCSLDHLLMKLWKRGGAGSEQQAGGRPGSSQSCSLPRVSTNPNGAEDARSLRLLWKTNSNGKHKHNNNNNISKGVGGCQERCWAEATRRSLQHLPGILSASPEPWSRGKASPVSSGGQPRFSSLPYYFPNNLANHNQSANLANHRSNSNFSSLPIETGFYV